VSVSLALNGLPVGIALAVRAEAFSATLAARSWVIRQRAERRAHLLLLQSDRGRASWHGTNVALEAPTLLWLPGNTDAAVEVGPGAHGFLLSVDDDFLIKIVAGNAEALHLRRITERAALIGGEALPPHLDAIAESCRAIVAELRTPGYGGATLISSHLLLLCLQLWRLSAARTLPAREKLRPARHHPRAPGPRSLHASPAAGSSGRADRIWSGLSRPGLLQSFLPQVPRRVTRQLPKANTTGARA